jgi:UDP-N-acetylmuramoyl-tripeptide--D-alanyl-D-alanine ligase
MILNPFKYIYFHLYILQLDEYEIGRYLRYMIKTRGKPATNLRNNIKWTWKAKMLESMTGAIVIVAIIAICLSIQKFWIAALLIGLVVSSYFYLHLIFLTIGVLFLWPIEITLKRLIISRAAQIIKGYPDLKIIGVAGSYGKTLMKEMIASVLAQKYQVLKTPENINTLLGISELITSKLSKTTEILIVEMGEYYPGDVRGICHLTPPGVGIITGINEAHLERMGSIDATIRTIFELANEVKPGGIIILNASDLHVLNNADKYSKNKTVFWYSSDASPKHPFSVKNYRFFTDGSGIAFDVYEKTNRVMQLRLPLLARYVVGDVIASIIVARKLGLSWENIKNGISKISPPPHRLQAIKNETTGVLVIDDSYNGNPDGVAESIKVLSQFEGRRKIFITPGLVEMGQKTTEIHRKIGKQLARTVDLVMLIQNSVTNYIGEGLLEAGFPEERIIRFDNTLACHKGFAKYIKPKDVILFQNDWPDNYI